MTEKGESLTKQIEIARKNVEEWPEWMKSVAYFSSTVITASLPSAKDKPAEGNEIPSPNSHHTSK